MLRKNIPQKIFDCYYALAVEVSSGFFNNACDVDAAASAGLYKLISYFLKRKLTDLGSYKGYARKIFKNTCIDQLRKNKTHIEKCVPVWHADSIAEETEYDYGIAPEAVMPLAKRILNANEYKLICLKFYDNLSYREIAGKLNYPEASIGSLYSRTIKKLRSAMREELSK